MPQQFLNYINGEFKRPASGEFFENRNPSHTSDVLGEFPRSNETDINAAVASAKAALAPWQMMTAPARGKLLFRVAGIMEDRKAEIADVILKEMAKPRGSAEGDVQSGIDLCRYMAGEGRRLFGQVTASELSGRSALCRRVPVGVCALITPWNAPMAAIAWKVFPALIAGNTVVLKPSKDTPHTAHLLAEILQEAGLPAGVFNLVHGFGGETGEALARHEDVRLISFTGSTEVGMKLAEIGASRLAKVSLEMGGKNAVLVMDDAELDNAVSAVVAGAFSLSGQRCSSTSRVIVHETIYGAFIEKIIAKASSLKVGPADEDGVDVIPIINEKQFNAITAAIEKAATGGIVCAFGGKALSGGAYDGGHYIAPTIFTDVPSDSALWQDEVFGPVLAVAKCSSFDEGISMINDSKYGLVASVFTNNVNCAQRAPELIRCGVVYINAPTFGSEVHLPFGGFKSSGNGHREPGAGSIDVFTEWQTVYVDYSGGVQNSQTSIKQ